MKMREKERVDYIYFTYEGKGRKKVTFQREEIAGIFVLKISIFEWKRKKGEEKESDFPDKIYKKIKRIIGKFQTEDCVLGADAYMAEKLNITELGFRARKQEMLQRKEYIFKELKVERKEGKNSILIAPDSESWDAKEILSLLLTAKDEYEELYVVSGEARLTELNRIAEFLYEEWGIVLHIQSQEMKSKIREYDFILFLLEKWDEQIIKKYEFKNAYVVMDEEEELVRYKEKSGKKQCGSLYAGLFYEKQHIPVPYQLAVDILYQNSALYDKLAVSCVDICRLECYNRKQ